MPTPAPRALDGESEELNLPWAVNARATFLPVQAFAAQFEGAGGRIILFTSGQHLAPMAAEIPYATKGTLQQLTLTLSDALIDHDITVNCVNPGPTDTSWATPDLAASVGRALPHGRWNTAEEAAGVVAMLLSQDSASITGQVINAESCFRRWKM